MSATKKIVRVLHYPRTDARAVRPYNIGEFCWFCNTIRLSINRPSEMTDAPEYIPTI